MYYPPVFTPVVRPFDSRSNALGGAADAAAPLVGPGRENPLDLSIKTIRQPAETPVEGDDLLMLDHRKLANLAASHSLSAMGRQIGPGGLDPALYRLGYAPEALVPPPFCYDRATGVAVPTSLAGHQFMTSFLQQQQQQRDRCLEQQALIAARTTAAVQQAAVAAAFMEPSSLPFSLRGAMSQREAAVALAATRGMYPPTLPGPVVLPAFSLYTDDKGAFTSLRSAGASDKSYLNGSSQAGTALEAARFAEHLQRLREQQHLQQSGKCPNACCSSISGLGTTVPCACCIQSPSQAALCARSPMGCLKDPTTAATAAKVCTTACDYLQSGLTYLHRPTAATAAPSELRLPVPGFCTATEATSSGPMFQPTATTWTTSLPGSSSSGKTAFSVPKKKEATKDCSVQKAGKDFNGLDTQDGCYKKEQEKVQPVIGAVIVKKEPPRPFEIDPPNETHSYIAQKHDVKSMLTPKTSGFVSRPVHHVQTYGAVAQTTVTAVTPIVSTRCEGGTIPKTKMPPVLQSFRVIDPPTHCNETSVDASTSVPSPQGPPPLIAVGKVCHLPKATAFSSVKVDGAFHATDSSTIRNQTLLSATNNLSRNEFCDVKPFDSRKCPKTAPSNLKATFVKEEPIAKNNNNPTLAIPKPIIPQIPAAHHLPGAAHYPSHYLPYSLQNHPSWVPPAHPNVTVAPAVPKNPTTTAASVSSGATQTTSQKVVVKSEPLPVVKTEPEYTAYGTNVLQSLLVRPANNGVQVAPAAAVHQAQSVIMPNPSSYPLLEYQYHMMHGLNLAHAGTSTATEPAGVISGGSPAAATVAPLEKVEPKMENVFVQSEPLVKTPKKRQCSTPTKIGECAADKKRCLAVETAAVPAAYALQCHSFPSEVKDAAISCPYTFAHETPSYYDNQVALSKDSRPFKPVYVQETPQGVAVPVIEDGSKAQSEGLPAAIALPLAPRTATSFLLDIQLRNAKRATAAKARSKLRKRILARIYGRRRILDAQTSSPSNANGSQVFPSAWREKRFLYKIVRRRRIRSGLDMILKRDRRRNRRVARSMVYKIQKQDLLKVPEAEFGTKGSERAGSSIPIPVEMKKIIVNKALGETVLHRAARQGYREVVAYCLETNCCNLNSRDNAGYTPLHECCSSGHLDIARALLQYGADVNASAVGGVRPLHDAVENNRVEVVRLLLSFGADLSISTYSGQSPLKLAKSALMAEFLQGFVADISGEMENRPYLPWRFWGSSTSLDPEVNGYDVFDGVPSDGEVEEEGEGDDFLFEVSDSPHLPTFRLALPLSNSKAHCNYLRLSDVLRRTSLSKEYFLERYAHIEVLTVPRHEFEATATCSQLLTGTKLDSLLASREHTDGLDAGHTVDLVKLDNNIRRVLGIETICVR